MYVLLGAAALATSRITVGAGVTNFATRHLSVTASAAATLQELSHGRTALGVGVGGTSTGMPLGLPHTTRLALSQAIQTVRALCAGQPVRDAGSEMRLAFGGAGKCPPIIVAALGAESVAPGRAARRRRDGRRWRLWADAAASQAAQRPRGSGGGRSRRRPLPHLSGRTGRLTPTSARCSPPSVAGRRVRGDGEQRLVAERRRPPRGRASARGLRPQRAHEPRREREVRRARPGPGRARVRHRRHWSSASSAPSSCSRSASTRSC